MNELLRLTTSHDMIKWITRIFATDIVSRLAKFDRVLFTSACIDVRDIDSFQFFSLAIVNQIAKL